MRQLVALLLLVSAGSVGAQIPETLTGRWSGASISNNVPLLFDLEFEVEDDSLMTILTQPYNGFTRFGFDFQYSPEGSADGMLTAGLFGDEMRLLVDLTDGTLRGTVSVEDSVTATVFLRRVLDYPLPSYSFEEVRFRAGEDTLAGTLIVPDGEGPHPAVVLVAGRGYGSGRGEIASWGLMLARNGIAALAFDVRGSGSSTGDPAATTSEDRFEDVRAALDWMQTRSEISRDKVGILSYSAGGWVTPIAIQGRGDVAFWISLAGPAEDLAAQQGHTTTELMRMSGETYSDTDYTAAFDYQSGLVELAQSGADWSTIEAVNATARAASWAEHALIPDSLNQEDLDYYRRRLGYTPAEALRQIEVPMLAIYGTRDFIVPPSENVPLLRSYLAEAGNDELTILVLEDVDHSLGRPGGATGDREWPVDYVRRWTRPGELFTTIVEWTQEQVARTR